MRITLLFSTTLLFLLSDTAIAEALHPVCLDRFTEVAKDSSIYTMTSLDLRACQKKYAHLTVEQNSPWQASFTASSTTMDTSEEERERLPAFATYNLIGQMENQQVLVSYAVNYGGSGTFTYGFLLKGLDLDSFPILDDALAGKKRSANLERTWILTGGDRCSGGITRMRIEAPDKISVTRSITPYGLVRLGVPEKQQANSYDDLPYCAICCIGKFTEIIDLNGGEPELREVRLTGSPLEEAKNQSKQQACLTRLINAGSNNVILNRKQLKELQESYAAQCL